MIADERAAHATTAGLERTRFFPRQLVTPADLTQDQTYFLDKLRRHNRYLHGWGVVRGANVRPGGGPSVVTIEAGLLLSPAGDEIVIPKDVTVDLQREGLDGYVVQPCGEGPDSWSSDVTVDRTGQRLFLAVRHAVCPTRPVRALTDTCASDPVPFEYSRSRDSYAVAALDALPDAYLPRDGGTDAPDSASDVDGPWVVLASVVVRGGGQPPEIGGVARWFPAGGAAAAPSPSSRPRLVAFTIERNPIRGGQTVTGTILLSGPAPADAVVAVTASGVPVTVPAGVDLTEGESSATFEIGAPGGTLGNATITLFYEETTFEARLLVISATG